MMGVRKEASEREREGEREGEQEERVGKDGSEWHVVVVAMTYSRHAIIFCMHSPLPLLLLLLLLLLLCRSPSTTSASAVSDSRMSAVWK